MKKFLLIFIGVLLATQNSAVSAVSIKKAAPVATKQASKIDASASLLPSVLNLVGSVTQLTQQQRQLSEECVPTSLEVNWVNDMVKEWAKTGAAHSDNVFEKLDSGAEACGESDSYSASVKDYGDDATDGDICYDTFKDEGMVWDGFPKAAKASYCKDDPSGTCSSKNKVHVSNIYDIFDIVDFDDVDYTRDEATMSAKLKEKMEKCAPARIKAKKAELGMKFVSDTVGSLGKGTNTSSIMQAVTNVAGSTGNGAGGMLQSLGGVATMLMGNQN